MSNDESSNVPASRDRREAVREKAQQVHASQRRASRIRIALLSLGGLVVVGAIVAGVAVAVGSAASKPDLQPATASGGGFEVAPAAFASVSDAGDDANAAEATPTPTVNASTVHISVYVDFLSSGAAEFQDANSDQLSTWVTDGAATLTYHPVAMLTAKSNGTKYSLRAANAAACVADSSPTTLYAYIEALLDDQPATDAPGLSNEELAAVAEDLDSTSMSAIRTCIEDEEFTGWVRESTDAALSGIDGTDGLKLTASPMILVNGEQYLGAVDDPKEFAQFVLTTASQAYYSTPTPTPSATPSASASN